MMILFVLITAILTIFLSVAVYNFYTAPLFIRTSRNKEFNSLISVLIPARNEEKNIRRILSDLVIQDYPDFEILVGNDNSEDGTGKILDEFAADYPFIKKVDIPPLEPGWKPKSFVLSELYKYSSGKLILFIDADVRLKQGTLSSAAFYMSRYPADVLSVFPEQVMLTLGEKIIVPLLNLFLLSLLPLKKVYGSARVSFSAGIGQFMLFSKESYERAGRHEAVRYKIAEDVELTRIAKRKGLKVLTMLDEGLVSCRMYDSFQSASDGFTKNFFRGTSVPPVLFLFSVFIFSASFLAPLVLMFFIPIYIIPALMIFASRVLITIRSRQDLSTLIYHPIQLVIFLYVGIRSVFMHDKIKWKGRPV